MASLTLKGYTFNQPVVRDSFLRRAVFFQNKIITILGEFGLTADDVNIELESVPFKKLPASASWYLDGHHLHYSSNVCDKYVENLAVVCKVIELEVEQVTSGQKTMMEFMREFVEDEEVEQQRKDARALLGVAEDEKDLDVIDKKYKDLAKTMHPDMDGGDIDKFKALNRAHKLLRKELQ